MPPVFSNTNAHTRPIGNLGSAGVGVLGGRNRTRIHGAGAAHPALNKQPRKAVLSVFDNLKSTCHTVVQTLESVPVEEAAYLGSETSVPASELMFKLWHVLRRLGTITDLSNNLTLNSEPADSFNDGGANEPTSPRQKLRYYQNRMERVQTQIEEINQKVNTEAFDSSIQTIAQKHQEEVRQMEMRIANLQERSKQKLKEQRDLHLSTMRELKESEAELLNELQLREEELAMLKAKASNQQAEKGFISRLIKRKGRVKAPTVQSGLPGLDTIGPRHIHPAGTYAPLGTVTCVFTDIGDSSRIWEADGTFMKRALEYHDSLLRANVLKYNGYEVKTIGDSFFLAFGDTLDAVLFCIAVQTELLRVDWPKYNGVDLPALRQRSGSDGNLLWKGLQVRTGIHTGEPYPQNNPVTGRMDYYGPCVNKAARVSARGKPGLITFTEEVYEYVVRFEDDLPAHTVEIQEQIVLRGMSDLIPLFRMVPIELAGRFDDAVGMDETPSKWDVGVYSTEAGDVPRGEVAMVHLIISELPQIRKAQLKCLNSVITGYLDDLDRSLVGLPAVRFYNAEHVSETKVDVAFSSPGMALQWCLSIQTELLEYPWPEELLQHDACQRVHWGDKLIHCGFRLKAAIHFCLGTPVVDTAHDRVMYNDREVLYAAQLAKYAADGEILISKAVHGKVCSQLRTLGLPTIAEAKNLSADHVVEDLQPYSVYPASLVERKSLAETENRRRAPLTESEMMAQAIQRARGNPRLEAIIEKWERVLMATHDPMEGGATEEMEIDGPTTNFHEASIATMSSDATMDQDEMDKLIGNHQWNCDCGVISKENEELKQRLKQQDDRLRSLEQYTDIDVLLLHGLVRQYCGILKYYIRTNVEGGDAAGMEDEAFVAKWVSVSRILQSHWDPNYREEFNHKKRRPKDQWNLLLSGTLDTDAKEDAHRLDSGRLFSSVTGMLAKSFTVVKGVVHIAKQPLLAPARDDLPARDDDDMESVGSMPGTPRLPEGYGSGNSPWFHPL